MKWGFLVLLLLIACAQPAVQPVSQPVVVEKVVEKVVVQCWDGSTAESVDKCPAKPEEKIIAKEVVAPEQKAETSVSIGRQLLNQAQAQGAYAYELEDRFVLVSGNKARHVFFKVVFIDRKPTSDVFVDLAGKTAVAYCNVENEAQMLGNAFTWAVSDCKHFVDEGRSMEFKDWALKGPLDYLADFADIEPEFVEDNVQMVNSDSVPKTVQPSLHYLVDGVRVILHIDQRLQVPVQIEIEGQQPISFRNIYFDTMPLYGGKEKIADLIEYKPVSQAWLKENAQ